MRDERMGGFDSLQDSCLGMRRIQSRNGCEVIIASLHQCGEGCIECNACCVNVLDCVLHCADTSCFGRCCFLSNTLRCCLLGCADGAIQCGHTSVSRIQLLTYAGQVERPSFALFMCKRDGGIRLLSTLLDFDGGREFRVGVTVSVAAFITVIPSVDVMLNGSRVFCPRCCCVACRD
jgi:hypothetical protein